MGLYSMSNDGQLYWKCHHPKPDCKTRTAHISDEGVRWTSPGEVSLPACPACGEQRMLKVAFSDEEKLADNCIQYGMVPTPIDVPHPITGEMLKALIPAFKAVGANPFHVMHMELARQLIAAGKLPPTREEQSDVTRAQSS